MIRLLRFKKAILMHVKSDKDFFRHLSSKQGVEFIIMKQFHDNFRSVFWHLPKRVLPYSKIE